MKTIADIIVTGEDRLKEAIILYEAQSYTAAIYLAGYALELFFKAKICERLALPNLFDEEFVLENIAGMEFKRTGEFRKFFKTHELGKLFLLSGLHIRLENEMVIYTELRHSWTIICDTGWNEELRYALNNLLFANRNQQFYHCC